MKNRLINFMGVFFRKLKYHFHGFFKAMIYGFIFISFIPVSANYIYHKVSPTSNYYLYNPTEPVKVIEGNKVGDYLILESDSFYKKDIKISWYDSLYCNEIKYNTQIWEDFVRSSDTFEKTKWAFDSYVFENKDSHKLCRVCGEIVGETYWDIKKKASYCTDYFVIQK